MTNREDKKAKVIAQLANWIDTRVIAEMIADHMECETGKMSFKEGKRLWAEVLNSIGGGAPLLC